MSFRHKLPSAGSVVLLVLALGLLWLTQGDARSGRTGPDGDSGGGRTPAIVTAVVDGDTAHMRVDGMGDEDVRFIGVDTPETVDPNEPVGCYGHEASDFTHRLLEGERVTLAFGAERRDRYGRLLAYIHLGDTFVNAELVRRGFARTLEIEPNTDHASLFARLQQQAANAGRGLWGAC